MKMFIFLYFFSGIIQTAILTILKDSTITEEEVKLKSSHRKMIAIKRDRKFNQTAPRVIVFNPN